MATNPMFVDPDPGVLAALQDQATRQRLETCQGQTCVFCDAPAEYKIGEEILERNALAWRHNLTAYVCGTHFRMCVHFWSSRAYGRVLTRAIAVAHAWSLQKVESEEDALGMLQQFLAAVDDLVVAVGEVERACPTTS